MVKGAEGRHIPSTVPETYRGGGGKMFLRPECGAAQVWFLTRSSCGAMVFGCDTATIQTFPVGYRPHNLASSGLKVGTPSSPVSAPFWCLGVEPPSCLALYRATEPNPCVHLDPCVERIVGKINMPTKH